MDWFITDHLGSTKLLIDQNGQHRFTGDDDPFGVNLRSFGDKDTHRFTGQILDEEQGIYYYGARYYLPEVGRFLATDAREEYHSSYLYVGNNPIRLVDPTGNGSDDPKDAGTEYPSGVLGAQAAREGMIRVMTEKGYAAIQANTAQMVKDGVPEKVAAQWGVEARNTFKTAMREKGSAIVDEWAKASRGLADKPSYEYLRSRGKTDAQIIERLSVPNAAASRISSILKVGGIAIIAVDIAVTGVKIAQAPQVQRFNMVVTKAASLAGGWAGFELGATYGAKGGVAVGLWFEGVGAAPGAVIGGLGGGLLGAWGGSWMAEKAAEKTLNTFFPPNKVEH